MKTNKAMKKPHTSSTYFTTKNANSILIILISFIRSNYTSLDCSKWFLYWVISVNIVEMDIMWYYAGIKNWLNGIKFLVLEKIWRQKKSILKLVAVYRRVCSFDFKQWRIMPTREGISYAVSALDSHVEVPGSNPAAGPLDFFLLEAH